MLRNLVDKITFRLFSNSLWRSRWLFDFSSSHAISVSLCKIVKIGSFYKWADLHDSAKASEVVEFLEPTCRSTAHLKATLSTQHEKGGREGMTWSFSSSACSKDRGASRRRTSLNQSNGVTGRADARCWQSVGTVKERIEDTHVSQRRHYGHYSPSVACDHDLASLR